MEREYKAEMYGVEYVCDSCSVGLMLYTGKFKLHSDPNVYEHRCGACGHEECLPEKYPTVRFRHVDYYHTTPQQKESDPCHIVINTNTLRDQTVRKCPE
jgi:hypothetical protein